MKLTQEQIERIHACTSFEEVIALAKEYGANPTEEEVAALLQAFEKNAAVADDVLEDIAGGGQKQANNAYEWVFLSATIIGCGVKAVYSIATQEPGKGCDNLVLN